MTKTKIPIGGGAALKALCANCTGGQHGDAQPVPSAMPIRYRRYADHRECDRPGQKVAGNDLAQGRGRVFAGGQRQISSGEYWRQRNSDAYQRPDASPYAPRMDISKRCSSRWNAKSTTMVDVCQWAGRYNDKIRIPFVYGRYWRGTGAYQHAPLQSQVHLDAHRLTPARGVAT